MQLAGSARTTERPTVTAHRTPSWVKVTALAAALLAALALSACGDSKSKSATNSGAAKTPSTTAKSGGGGSAADTAAITAAYTKLFAPTTPLDTSVSLLQDGEAFRATLESEGKTTYAKQASVTVSKVTVNSPNRATVIFSVLINKSPILPNQTGYAVREKGTWKVAGATFCGLLTAQGNPPAACKQAVATSLPS